MKYYIAAPLFSQAERQFNQQFAQALQQAFPTDDFYLPQEVSYTASSEIFHELKINLDECDRVIAVLDGADADSGTAWEMGYAFAQNKPIYVLRTDFRQSGDDGGLNLMLSHSATGIFSSIDTLIRVGLGQTR